MIVRAILEKRHIIFDYHGRDGPSRREVSPHTVVYVADRLHLRGWDHNRGAPRDFVMTRIRWVKLGTKAAFYDRTEDHEWSERVWIEVSPKPGEDREALRLDYGLNPEVGDRALYRIRRAHLIYLLDEGEGGVAAPVIVRRADL